MDKIERKLENSELDIEIFVSDILGEEAKTGETHLEIETPLVILAENITKEDSSIIREFTDGSRTGALVDHLQEG